MEYRIVVVDDEALSLTNARNLLCEEKMRVSCLRCGKDLIRFIEKNTPDLILLDILMPEMDGFETYEALRRFEDENGRNHVPVIFLTGENDSETESRGLSLGASDFIRKPFNKDTLLSRIYRTISNNKTIESLTEKATVDKMTGFLNKASGTLKISSMCEKNTGCFAIMDLDNFKLVNDLHGHDMGDRVLESFSDIVRANIRESDVVCRIGGDEFMAFFSGLNEEKAVESLTKRLNDQLTKALANLIGEDNGLPLGMSLGAVMVPDYGIEYETLFVMADSSLYHVKQNGKHGYCIYSSEKADVNTDINDFAMELEQITKIVEERNETGGALVLGTEAFSIIYQFMVRFYKRYGGNAVRLLFVLSKEDAESDIDLSAKSSDFENILQKTLRKSDVILRNKTNSFFVVLVENNKFEAQTVIDRVLRLWDVSGHGNDIKIDYTFEYDDYPAKEN